MIEINWNPTRKDLWIFAGILSAMLLTLAALGQLRFGWPTGVNVGLAAVSLVLLLTACLRIAWVRPVYLGWMLAVFPIGWVVSHLVLAAVYFGVFWPIGLALRLTGYDPLQLRPSPDRTSYWTKRPSAPSAERYFRQY